MPVGISPQDLLKYTGPKRGLIPIVEGPRIPLVGDTNYAVGSFWRVEKNPQTGAEGDTYILIKFETTGDATWQKLATSSSSGNLDTVSGDSGTSPVLADGSGNIAITGDGSQGISSVGGTNTLDFTIADATDSQKGVSTFNSSDFTVSGGDVSLASSSIVLTMTGDNASAAGPVAGNFDIVGANGITTNTSSGNITITGSDAGINTVNNVTTTSVTIAGGTVHILDNASLVTATLPSSCAVGDTFKIVGKGAGGWKLAQEAGDTIHFGESDTTTGTGGSIASSLRYDCIEVVCTTANTGWTVTSSIGNLTIV